MKTCPNCNSTFADNQSFCSNCGTQLQAPQPQQYTQPQQYAQPQQYTPQPVQKKKSKGKVIAIVAAVLIILSIIGSVAQKTFQQQGYGQTDSDEIVNDYDDENMVHDTRVHYSKGTFENNIYTNTWALLKFDATSDWTNASEEQYALFDSDGVECGLMLNDYATQRQIIVAFEDLTGIRITAEEYLSNASSAMEQTYTQQNLTSTFSEPYNLTVAGETFVAQTVTFEQSQLVVITSARVYDNRAIYITATAQSSAEARAIMNSFTAY